MKSIRKTFNFGKIAYTSTRKVNAVDIEMELRYTDKGPELSICGNIWNSRHTDIVIGGQCLDKMNQIEDIHGNSVFQELYRLHSLYHLNSLHAGTVRQEDALHNSGKHLHNYDDQCKYLDSVGLLYDGDYKYGTAWLYREIPENDLNKIKSMLA
jgi:hypothetical protein